MLVIIAAFTIADGKRAEFEKEFLVLAPKVRKDPGAIAYTLNRDSKDPNRVVFYEKYADQEAFKYHTSTEHFKEFFGKMKPIIASGPEIGTYEEVE